jgi:hypothetical protein
MSTPLPEEFPKGQVAIGNGPWKHCTGAKFSFENGADTVDTFGGQGYTTGPRKASATFETAIGVDGQDLDTLKKIANGEVVQVRFHFPVGRSVTITGVFDKTDFDFSLDKPIMESLSIKGVLKYI